MFYDVFSSLCLKKGVSANKACLDIGVSRTSTAKWKSGAVPNGVTLAKMSDYFGVSTDYLLGTEQKEKAPAETEASDPLSQVSFALFGKHEELDDEILGELREYARFKLEQKKHKEKK